MRNNAKCYFLWLFIFLQAMLIPQLSLAESAVHATNSKKILIDINKADLTQLQEIKGIGPKRAQTIIDYRQTHHGFQRIDELQRIKGIGKKLFNKIKKQVAL